MKINFEQTRANVESAYVNCDCITDYALELIDQLESSSLLDCIDYRNSEHLEKAMLNGADNWHHYSHGGCSLCYNYDIAKELYPDSDYADLENLYYEIAGEDSCSFGEFLLDKQAEKLEEAAELVIQKLEIDEEEDDDENDNKESN